MPTVPLLRPDLFRSRPLAMGALVSLIYGGGLYGSTYLVPVFLQTEFEYNATTAGFVLMPGGIALAATMPFAGRLADRVPAHLQTSGRLLLFGLSFLPVFPKRAYPSDAPNAGRRASEHAQPMAREPTACAPVQWPMGPDGLVLAFPDQQDFLPRIADPLPGPELRALALLDPAVHAHLSGLDRGVGRPPGLDDPESFEELIELDVVAAHGKFLGHLLTPRLL